MKIICVNAKRYNTVENRYNRENCPTLTQGKVYDVIKLEKIMGQLHYWIECDAGYVNWYFHKRFDKLGKPKNIKII